MSEEALREEFLSRREALKALGNWVISVVLDALEIELGSQKAVDDFLKVPPHCRVKDVDAFLEKSHRKSYTDPLNQITDQVGVRFVVLLSKEVELVGDLLKNDYWDVSKDLDFQEQRKTRPKYFSYESDHFIIRVNSKSTFSSVAIPQGIACEVQIRTLLQHAYAETSHRFYYKKCYDMSDEDEYRLLRSLAKGSALAETTDDIFYSIYDFTQRYDKHTNKLFSASTQAYKDAIGVSPRQGTPFSFFIADAFRTELKQHRVEEFSKWLKEADAALNGIKQNRHTSVLYQDAITLVIAWLIHIHRFEVKKKWPLDQSELEKFMRTIGISPQSLL